MAEIRKTTTITLPIDLYELVKNDKLVLSYFVESALRDYYNVKTKETEEIMRERQELENKLSILESDKDNYLKNHEIKKAEINFKLSQLEEQEKSAIENDSRNDKLDRLLKFLRVNRDSPAKQFNESAELFIEENNLEMTIEDLKVLKDNVNPLTMDNLKEFIEWS
jgi:hypothetical protein